MMRAIVISCMVLLGSAIASATAGYRGDIKVVSRQGDVYTVDNGEYRLTVDGKRLPHDIRKTWSQNVGKWITGTIPYQAVTAEKKLASAETAPVRDR